MLIELAVAALVIGIGILALLGITHVAERAATDAEGETRAALFADDVFTTLRLYSDHYAQSANQTNWINFWMNVTDEYNPLPLTVASAWLPIWDNSQNEDFPRVIFGDGQEHTTYWIPLAEDESEPVAIPDLAMRYRLTIVHPNNTAQNLVSINKEPLTTMLLATLHVWYGASRVGAEPSTFFTAFSNSGSLP